MSYYALSGTVDLTN